MAFANDKVTGLDARRLRDLLEYDAETGIFRWRSTNSNRAVAGSVAGTKDARKGYIYIRINGRRYLAHRLAWLYETGEWPVDLIDHRNLDTADNRFANLRQASDSDNKANKRPFGKYQKGVIFDARLRSKPFAARIMVRGKFIHLGMFETEEAAGAAYAVAARHHYGEFARSA